MKQARLVRRLADELFAYDRPETAGEILYFKGFELFVAGFTIRLAWSWGLYTQRISDVVLPLGIAEHIDISFMFGHGLALVNAGLITACVALGFFRVSRYAYLAALLLMHVQFAARFCLGEIPHSSNVLGTTLLGLSLAVILFPDGPRRSRFTFGFTYFFTGLGYTVAAACKLIGTGLTWPDGRHLWLWIHEKAVDAFAWSGTLAYNELQAFALQHHTAATALLVFGLVTELLAWAMWWRRFRTPVLLAIIGLHLGIYWAMNIMFWITFYELILLALPGAVWLDRLLAWSGRPKAVTRLERMSLRFA